jgi:hypothetical protein
MTAATAAPGRYREKLTGTEYRSVETVWNTSEHDEDGHQRQIVVDTTHNKRTKRLTVGVHTQSVDGPFVRRSFTLFERSADGGIDLATESVARFSAPTARRLHQSVLDGLESGTIAFPADPVGQELAGLWATRQ